MKAVRHLAAALAGLWLAAAAHAHQASDAFLTLRVDGTAVEQRLDVALRDLDRDLALDADGDGLLRWHEVRDRWAELERLVDAAVVVRADGSPCRSQARATPMLDEHADGRHAVLQRTLQCEAAPLVFSIDYRLFAATDPTHRGITRIVTADGTPHTRVLVPGAAPLEVSASGAPSATAAPQGAAGFFFEGLRHIAGGADHVLFVITLLLVAVWRREGGRWAPREQARSAWAEALRLVTAFTVAHSLTLGLAAAGVLAPPPRWIESLIALSVLVAAVDNLRPFVPGPRWLTVGFFGLVHGFGFAGPLQDLGLRGGELVMPLISFNLGVEAGQLLIVLMLLPLALVLRHTSTYRRWIVAPASAAVALLALGWTLQRALELPSPLG
jgi:HupE / UreJ protein